MANYLQIGSQFISEEQIESIELANPENVPAIHIKVVGGETHTFTGETMDAIRGPLETYLSLSSYVLVESSADFTPTSISR